MIHQIHNNQRPISTVIGWLTTDSAASHYGIPVLRLNVEGYRDDYGPADMIPRWLGPLDEDDPDGPDLAPAAYLVHAWAGYPERSAAEKEAARAFLAQWPDGPQLE